MTTGSGSKTSNVRKKRGKKKAAGGTGASKAAKRRRKKQSTREPARTLVLGGKLCIGEVGALKERLTAALEADGSIVIDASGVEAVDTAALQLLTAFANSARGQSRPLEWQNPSAALQESAVLLDLDGSLGLNTSPDGKQDDKTGPAF